VNWTQEQYDDLMRQYRRSCHAHVEGPGPETVERADMPGPIIPKSRMNKTEAKFADYLEAEKHLKRILDWRFEPVKFILAQNIKGKRNATTYTPDFIVITRDCVGFVEVKGFWRDDAKVKIKVAADMFPWFKWRVVYLKKGEWIFEEV